MLNQMLPMMSFNVRCRGQTNRDVVLTCFQLLKIRGSQIQFSIFYYTLLAVSTFYI